MKNNKEPEPSDLKFTDPHAKIDNLIKKKDVQGGKQYQYDQQQQVYSNLMFRNKTKEKPIKAGKYEKKIFGVEYIDLQPYLDMRMWPRSIYVTDKLIRLVAASRLEFLKRYLAKKRTMPFNMWWLLIIMFGVAGAILLIIFLLPKLGGVVPI